MSQQEVYRDHSEHTSSPIGPVAWNSSTRSRDPRPRLTESELIADLRGVARLLNHSPSSVEYARFGRYHVRTLQRKFDISWKEIVAAAGLRYTRRTSRRIPTTEELRQDVCRVANEVKHPPTRSEYQTHGRFGAETIKRRTGEKKWEDAVASLTGYDREEVKLYQRKGGCYRTTKEWLTRLRELAQTLGHAPTTRESNQGGINAHQLCVRIGGKWVDVLKGAGIDLNSRSQYAALRSTPTEALVDDIVMVSKRQGRPVKMREYMARGRFPYTAVMRRLGGWRKVKSLVAQKLLEDKNLAGLKSRP